MFPNLQHMLSSNIELLADWPVRLLLLYTRVSAWLENTMYKIDIRIIEGKWLLTTQ